MTLQTRPWVGTAAEPQTGPALPLLRANAGTEVANAGGQLLLTNVFGGPGPTNVANVFNWRVDRQNAPAGFVNISVQRNGVGAPSTVATVFVPTTLNIAPGPGGLNSDQHKARCNEIIRAIRRGLQESHATHAVAGGHGMITRMEVHGALSA